MAKFFCAMNLINHLISIDFIYNGVVFLEFMLHPFFLNVTATFRSNKLTFSNSHVKIALSRKTVETQDRSINIISRTLSFWRKKKQWHLVFLASTIFLIILLSNKFMKVYSHVSTFSPLFNSKINGLHGNK